MGLKLNRRIFVLEKLLDFLIENYEITKNIVPQAELLKKCRGNGKGGGDIPKIFEEFRVEGLFKKRKEKRVLYEVDINKLINFCKNSEFYAISKKVDTLFYNDRVHLLGSIYKMVTYRKDPCCKEHISLSYFREERELYPQEMLIGTALKNINGNPYKVFIEFKRIGFLKNSDTDLYYIDIEEIKKFINSKEIIQMIENIKRENENDNLSKNSKKFNELNEICRLPKRIEELSGLH